MYEQEESPNGYSIDLNKAILETAGFKVVIESLPWARVLKRSKDKALSVISAIVRTPEREEDFFWITPISVNAISIYTMGSPAHRIHSLEDASLLGNIAVLRGDYRHQILNQQLADKTLAFNQWSVAIKALLRGRTQSLFFSDMGLILTCINNNLDCEAIQQAYTYRQSTSYLALRKTPQTEPIHQVLKQAAKEFKSSKDFKELVDHYLRGNHPAAKYLTMHEGAIHVRL